MVWQEHFEVPESEVIFSTRWIKDREADTPNPIDAIQFQKLVKDIEVGIKQGTRKRIFDANDRIKLSPETIKYVVEKLQGTFLFGIDIDLNGRLFETFLSVTMRGKDLGQFFTPRSIVKLGTKLANLRAPTVGKVDVVLDGCCGTGGFLIDALADMWSKIDQNPTLSDTKRSDLRKQVATQSLFGIDVGKDPNQARLARMNMYLHGDGGSSIYEADFLDKNLLPSASDDAETAGYTDQLRTQFESGPKGLFDVILTNPPFAKQYDRKNVIQSAILDSYKIAENQNSVKSSLLFFERYHDVLRAGGMLVSVIDDGLLSARDYSFFRDFLRERFLVRGVVSLPGDAFQRSQARVKTSLIVLEKKDDEIEQTQGPVFMYACRYIGVDDPKRQRTLPIDRINRAEANKEIETVSKMFTAFLNGESNVAEHVVPASKIANRLDVKSCFAKSGAMVKTWKKKGIETATLGSLLNEYVFAESDIVKTDASDEELSYLQVGYDGAVRKGDAFPASDAKSSKLFKVHADQIVISHINAVHGSIGVVPKELDGCVVTSEFSCLVSNGQVDPRLLVAIIRSPEIRADLLISASGVGRTRVEWEVIKNIVIPIPDPATAKDIVERMEKAEKMSKDAEMAQAKAKRDVEKTYSLATEAALATLAQFKPPK